MSYTIPPLVEKVGDIEDPIGDLDTAVKALHHFADSMDSPERAMMRFVAQALEGIHGKLYAAFEVANSAVHEESRDELRTLRQQIKPVEGGKP